MEEIKRFTPKEDQYIREIGEHLGRTEVTICQII